jgi:hypothetical protein
MKPQAPLVRHVTTFVFFFLLAAILCSSNAWAQSLTSGDVAGTVVDPSGAAVSNANVTLTNRDTGTKQTTTTNGSGAYRFGLLKPSPDSNPLNKTSP